jgi:Plant protein of unknown function
MTQNDDNLIIDMERIIKALQRKTKEGLFLNHKFSIYRIPAHIRKNNENYYEPRMVSIGPYHREKEHLRAMEEHKWRYLNEFTKKNDGILLRCTKEMKNLEEKSRACYFENVHLKSNQFFEMMLLDSLFIIQLFMKWRYNKKDAPLHIGWASPLLMNDLLMLENQIPFFVLTKMYEIYTSIDVHPPDADNTQDNNWPSFITLVEDTLHSWLLIYERNEEEGMPKDLEVSLPKNIFHQFYNLLILGQKDAQNSDDISPPARPLNEEERSSNTDVYQPNHLLDIFYHLFVGAQNKRRPQGTIKSKELSSETHAGKSLLVQKCHHRKFCGPKKFSKLRRSPRVMPSAIELEEFGVTLRKKEKFKSFLDISFKGGILEVPCFTIEESSRSRILNLIAFEQCNDVNVDPIDKPLASYAAFLACLMNISEDVIAIERAGIIENNLANSEEGAMFFRQIRECAHIEVDNHYLKEVFVQVNDHCHAFWPKHKARLRRDYFSSPWTIFSLGAALLVLSIAVFRVVCFMLITFFHKLK